MAYPTPQPTSPVPDRHPHVPPQIHAAIAQFENSLLGLVDRNGVLPAKGLQLALQKLGGDIMEAQAQVHGAQPQPTQTPAPQPPDNAASAPVTGKDMTDLKAAASQRKGNLNMHMDSVAHAMRTGMAQAKVRNAKRRGGTNGY